MTNPEIVLTLTEVSKEYHSDNVSVRALRSVNLALHRAEFLGIVGPSGCGKSTLLSIMGLVIRPTEGQVLFNGQDLSNAPDNHLRSLRCSSIGFVFQYFHLLPALTALENVALPLLLNGHTKSEAYEVSIDVLKEVGLESRMQHYPAQLSGGEMQRVAICRAIVHRPALILADEPTGNLESARGHEIMKLLADMTNRVGCAVAMVTHNEEMLQPCHRVVHLRDGCLLP